MTEAEKWAERRAGHRKMVIAFSDLVDAYEAGTIHGVLGAKDEFLKALWEREGYLKIIGDATEMRKELKLAVRYLREGKAKFAPHTTNSHVDDFITKHSEESD